MAHGVDLTAAIRYRKGLALLGFLAAQHGRQHPREQLADLLWPDLEMAAARTNLRQVLIPLAQVLNRKADAPVLLATKNSIGLFPGADTEIDVDAIASLANTDAGLTARTPARHEFERRLKLIRGEFLAGLTLPDCEEFEQWLQHTRRSFHVRATAFLERLCVEHESTGQLPLAIMVAERLIALDVWHEPHQCLLMRLLARAGQPRAALAVFDALAENLQRQLGVEPDSQTRALHAGILAGSSLDNTIAASAEAGATSSERRWVTVLCCEVRSRHEDSERAAEHCGELLAQAVDHLRAAGACPLPPMGHRLVAYFGSPHTHDDAARRAALTALHIQRSAPPTTTVRLGIHAGMALIQTVAGAPRLIGEVTETAMRLRLIVDEGEIAIDEAALRQIAVHCQVDPLGVRRLRGMTTPLAVYRLVGISDTPFRARTHLSLSPLVGRDAELKSLMGLWRDACAGRTRVSLLIGESGIGKTRLVRELGARANATGATVHILSARPESAARPFAPFAGWIECLAGIRDDDAPARRRRLLHDYLDEAVGGAHARRLGVTLSDLIGGDESSAGAAVADNARQRWSEALIELFGRLAARCAALICCEDAHWADISTLELLPRLCPAGGMVIVTVRPEGIPPGLPMNVVPLVLRPLDEHASRAIVHAHATGTDLSETHLRELLHRGNGNPLSLEEFSKAAQRPSGHAALPATLFDLLQAQFDRIGTLKPLLQAAAAFGQRFSGRLLARLLESPDLFTELEHACRSGLIVACDGGEHRFRHALIREVAYLTLPRARRRALHASIHRLLAEEALTPLEERARHLENAGEYAEAAGHWQAAGLLAYDRRFAAEAVAHLERALKLRSLGDSAPEACLALRQHLAEAHLLGKDHAARRVQTRTSPVLAAGQAVPV